MQGFYKTDTLKDHSNIPLHFQIKQYMVGQRIMQLGVHHQIFLSIKWALCSELIICRILCGVLLEEKLQLGKANLDVKTDKE